MGSAKASKRLQSDALVSRLPSAAGTTSCAKPSEVVAPGLGSVMPPALKTAGSNTLAEYDVLEIFGSEDGIMYVIKGKMEDRAKDWILRKFTKGTAKRVGGKLLKATSWVWGLPLHFATGAGGCLYECLESYDW